MKTVLKRAFGRRKRKAPVQTDGGARWTMDGLRQQLPEVEQAVLEILYSVQHTTMTSPERVLAFCDAIQHITRNEIPGAIVECGVWRGGSMSAAAQMLQRLDSANRDLWLYDTFCGMSEPTDVDHDFLGRDAGEMLDTQDPEDEQSIWCKSGIEEVRTTMRKSGYSEDLLHLVPGKVEDTLPIQKPEQIAVLRLDTDWYESTKVELEELFPLLSPGGILIVDDYGHWDGCRRAVDEYFTNHQVEMYLHRIDYTGRMGVHCPVVNRPKGN